MQKTSIEGDALLNNNGFSDEFGQFKTNYAVEAIFAKVVTPNVDDLNGGVSRQNVLFTIGDANYTVGTETTVAQIAPYISKDDRTMVAIKELAFEVGVSEANINWDYATIIVPFN